MLKMILKGVKMVEEWLKIVNKSFQMIENSLKIEEEWSKMGSVYD
jgi:hypothetical protein